MRFAGKSLSEMHSMIRREYIIYTLTCKIMLLSSRFYTTVHSSPHEVPMANPEPQLSTLQHLTDALTAAPDRTDVQKRDEVSAVRTVAKALGAEPSVIALNVKLLRQRIEEVSPTAIGLSQSRWNNVRSLFSRALQLVVAVKRSPVGVPISPA
jgi:hypothetical protein